MDIKIDLSKTIIQTDRLILRYWVEEDLADFFAYASVPGVGEMAGWKHHSSPEESRQILGLFREGKDVLALVLKKANKVIGSLGLHYSWANEAAEYEELRVKEIGYALSRDYWGQGLMPEAVRAIVDFSFSELGLDMLTCGHFAENHQSRRVIEKCGFHFVEEAPFHSSQLQKTFTGLRYILKRSRDKPAITLK